MWLPSMPESTTPTRTSGLPDCFCCACARVDHAPCPTAGLERVVAGGISTPGWSDRQLAVVQRLLEAREVLLAEVIAHFLDERIARQRLGERRVLRRDDEHAGLAARDQLVTTPPAF